MHTVPLCDLLSCQITSSDHYFICSWLTHIQANHFRDANIVKHRESGLAIVRQDTMICIGIHHYIIQATSSRELKISLKREYSISIACKYSFHHLNAGSWGMSAVFGKTLNNYYLMESSLWVVPWIHRL